MEKGSFIMNKAEIIAFINANPNCHVATVEGNKPHVRGIRIWKADENGIIIQTSTLKDLYKQLSDNPNVELCFNNYRDGIQVRVSGAVELVDDLELKKEVIAQRPFLKQQIEKGGREAIVVYRLKGTAHVWTMETNLDPKTYIQL
jgi:pyridoxamine 5'-phosphate oxidase